MRIVIFSPVSERSAIGRVAALVAPVLVASGHRLSIVAIEASPFDKAHAYPCEIVSWTDRARVEQQLCDADATAFHIGNSFDFHCGALDWLPRAGGLVCLHDFFLGHLFWGWAQDRRDLARRILCRWYGTAIADRYFTFATPDAFIEGTHRDAPMLEWVASMADGVLTHSGWAIERVLQSCAGPVSVTPLAYDAPGLRSGREPQTDTGRPLTVMTFGQINPNKRVASVVRAIAASSRLRAHVEYVVVGRIEADLSSRLAALASRLNVRLVITGEVDDATLQSLSARADVICCIRWPALEAASASAIEAMLYGKPAIVADTAFYRDLPDDCVLKVDPADEHRQIQAALGRMLDDVRERRAIGQRAATWARATFTAENYAEAMIAACDAVRRSKPALAAVRWCAHTLAEWGAEAPELGHPLLLEPLELIAASSRATPDDW
jgi:glycosyltransferase involved in cell wall biosynthesis